MAVIRSCVDGVIRAAADGDNELLDRIRADCAEAVAHDEASVQAEAARLADAAAARCVGLINADLRSTMASLVSLEDASAAAVARTGGLTRLSEVLAEAAPPAVDGRAAAGRAVAAVVESALAAAAEVDMAAALDDLDADVPVDAEAAAPLDIVGCLVRTGGGDPPEGVMSATEAADMGVRLAREAGEAASRRVEAARADRQTHRDGAVRDCRAATASLVESAVAAKESECSREGAVPRASMVAWRDERIAEVQACAREALGVWAADAADVAEAARVSAQAKLDRVCGSNDALIGRHMASAEGEVRSAVAGHMEAEVHRELEAAVGAAMPAILAATSVDAARAAESSAVARLDATVPAVLSGDGQSVVRGMWEASTSAGVMACRALGESMSADQVRSAGESAIRDGMSYAADVRSRLKSQVRSAALKRVAEVTPPPVVRHVQVVHKKKRAWYKF